MLTVLAILVLAAVALPNVVIAVELIAGLSPRPLRIPVMPMPTTVVLVPAHDEALGMETMLARVLPVMPLGGRVLVVADNCTDDTAAIARRAGVDVVERHNPSRRGKGYALAYGRAALAATVDVPDVVIVLDADCTVEPEALDRLARSAVASGRPVQGCYLLKPRPVASPMVQISGLAFLVKNLVRQAGLARIGAPAALTGSGMAFPWQLFVEAPLATDDIVEDLGIGIALARAGAPPLFDPAARIWSEPAATVGTLGQRTRWEHGFAITARSLMIPLIAEGMRRRRFGLAWIGLHVAVPPLALLLGIDVASLIAIGALRLAGAASAPFFLGAAMIGLVAVGVFAAWARHGRAQAGAATLVRAPIYLLWKLPIYVKLVRRAETQWIRTERE